jgi:trk system potassium uptake protein TrkA
MKIIIAGAGSIGFSLARRLSLEKHSLTLIDADPEQCARAQESLDVAVIAGSATSRETLAQAGIADADLFIAVTRSDETNMLACLMASRMGARRRIARVRDPGYFQEPALLEPGELGIDLYIRPEEETVSKIDRLLMRSAASEIIELQGGRMLMVGIKLDAACPCIDVQLKDLGDEEGRTRFRVVAIVREGRTLIPTGNDALRRGDELFTVVAREHLGVVLSLFGKADERIATLMILGGGRIGLALAARLERQGIDIVLVDMDRATSVKAAGELERTTVVHAEASAIDTLASEGLLDKDAFVAVTGDDETNVLSCLLARRLGVRRTIALVNKESYLPLLSMIGIDASVNTRVAAADAILAFVRRREVRTLATLGDIDAEIVELEISADSRLVGTPLAALTVPPGSIVASIVRGDEVIIPTGASTLAAADRIAVFTLPRAARAVQRLFAR